MIRSRPRLSLGTKRANRNSLLRPQAHRRSASEASLALHSPLTHPSLALHSETKKMADMDQCTVGAVRPRGGRGAVRKRQSQNLGRARKEIRPSSSRMRSSGLQEGRRAASRLSPLKLLAKQREAALGDRCAPPPCAFASPRRQPQASHPSLFARLALTLGRAKAISPRPKRRTKLRPAF
jgi:hypothetical protein